MGRNIGLRPIGNSVTPSCSIIWYLFYGGRSENLVKVKTLKVQGFPDFVEFPVWSPKTSYEERGCKNGCQATATFIYLRNYLLCRLIHKWPQAIWPLPKFPPRWFHQWFCHCDPFLTFNRFWLWTVVASHASGLDFLEASAKVFKFWSKMRKVKNMIRLSANSFADRIGMLHCHIFADDAFLPSGGK